MKTLQVLSAWLLLCTLSSAEPHRFAAIGVTRQGTEIGVHLPADVRQLEDQRLRVLIIGGHDGQTSLLTKPAELQRSLTERFADKSLIDRRTLSLAIISNVHPDGLPDGMTPADAVIGYPPKAGFYDDAKHPESRYLWRWVAMYAADLVIDVRTGDKPSFWMAGESGSEEAMRKELRKELAQLPKPAGDDFSSQARELGQFAVVLQMPASSEQGTFEKTLATLIKSFPGGTSVLRGELARRELSSTQRIVQDLAEVYGKDLKQVAYIPSLAVIGRVRLSESLQDLQLAFVYKKIVDEQILAPFLSGAANPVPKSGSEQAGHLVFAELAKRSEGKDRERWIELCRAAADQIFDKDGKPLKLMPYHNEMSDAVFMATPIICATGKLTGEQKYFDAAVTHFRSMKKLCLRDDGLYRHSPLDEAAWGRGNGFPAMGLAWALSEFPEDHAAFPELKKDFQNHIAALLKHQDGFGCWHQVIDKLGSYREFSATAMIAWAIKRGLDRGWLDKETHQKPLDRAWIAVKQRIGPKGVIVDICTGTGKQKSLRDYYDRPAIWGVDARGGAMALMLATEMMNAN
jgi:unsaturated rhamnogalacturonyl hydrolase